MPAFRGDIGETSSSAGYSVTQLCACQDQQFAASTLVDCSAGQHPEIVSTESATDIGSAQSQKLTALLKEAHEMERLAIATSTIEVTRLCHGDRVVLTGPVVRSGA